MTTDIVGRTEELAALGSFLDRVQAGPGALILRGDPGIGKTALWERALEHARERGMVVLSARVDEGERHLSFAVLADLLDGLGGDVLAKIPSPQRTALEVAILRIEPTSKAPEPRAIGSGLLGVLRERATRVPVIVAVDDIQWTDSDSTDALSFAARRLSGEPVGFVVTERSGSRSGLRRSLDRIGSLTIDLDVLSFGAARHALSERLGLTLSRPAMRRIYDVTRGNPLFVLELGRTLVAHGSSDVTEDLPLPVDVDALLGVRLDGLPPVVRSAVLTVAVAGDSRRAHVADLVGIDALDAAVDAGLLIVERDRVRLFHPLLGAVARIQANAKDLRAIHRALAEISADRYHGARHLAMAATGPDEALAVTLSKAAADAGARGARNDAIIFTRQALDLTPPDSPQHPERLVCFAEALERAGDKSRSLAIIAPEIHRLPAGEMRARAHLLLLGGATSVPDYDANLEAVIIESHGLPELHARALAERAIDLAVDSLYRLDHAEQLAIEARTLDPRSAEAVAAVGWVRILRGRPVDDLVDREHAPGAVVPEIVHSLDRLAAIRSAFRGEIQAARTAFESLLHGADERGEAWSYGAILHQLCELSLRSGDLLAAGRYLDEVELGPDDETGPRAHRPRLHALLEAQAGGREATERWAVAVTDDSALIQRTPDRPGWDMLETARARGIAALFAGDADAAAADLSTVWRHMEREGIDDPGSFPVAPDLVEALTALGDVESASAVMTRLDRLAQDQAHPWGMAGVRRCEGLLRLAADATDTEGATLLAEAAEAYRALGLRFDRARTLLLLGRSQRRAKRWAAARRELVAAAEAFDEIGSAGWASAARSELTRVEGRRARSSTELTPAEERAASLAAGGLSNKEIAAAMFVGVHTVEVHLSRVYSKLGVRGRSQLVRHLHGAESTPKD